MFENFKSITLFVRHYVKDFGKVFAQRLVCVVGNEITVVQACTISGSFVAAIKTYAIPDRSAQDSFHFMQYTRERVETRSGFGSILFKL